MEGRFTIEGEDVHSEVEARLTAALGDVGKKVHTGRSRNDQVAVDIKLFTRARLEKTVGKVSSLFNLLQEKSEELKDVLMPGYTHLQVAMRDGRESPGKRRGVRIIGPAEAGPHDGAAGIQHLGLQQHLCADVPGTG